MRTDLKTGAVRHLRFHCKKLPLEKLSLDPIDALRRGAKPSKDRYPTSPHGGKLAQFFDR